MPSKCLSRSLAILLLSLSALALVGCDQVAPSEMSDEFALPDVSIAAFSDVTAELDFENGIAVTPMTPYMINQSFEYEVLFRKADATLISTCMAEQGLEYAKLAETDWDNLVPMEDRMFGLWDVDDAAKFGGEGDRGRGIPKGSVEEKVDKHYEMTWQECAYNLAKHPMLGGNGGDEPPSTIADRIYGNAVRQANESAEAKAANKKFAECLADRDIATDPETGYISSDYFELGKEVRLAASLAEAECNVDTGRIQTMFDLVARYETAYMKDYEPQLAAVMESKNENFAALQAIIDGEA